MYGTPLNNQYQILNIRFLSWSVIPISESKDGIVTYFKPCHSFDPDTEKLPDWAVEVSQPDIR